MEAQKTLPADELAAAKARLDGSAPPPSNPATPGADKTADGTKGRKGARRTRGKNIPRDVKNAVLNWLDAEMGGTVKKADGTDMTGSSAADGWRGAFDAFSVSDDCTARVRQYVGSWKAFQRVAEAARKARARELAKQKRRARSGRGQKK